MKIVSETRLSNSIERWNILQLQSWKEIKKIGWNKIFEKIIAQISLNFVKEINLQFKKLDGGQER